ncbi:MAG: succinate-semialdehyde dehydrogenase [Coxiella sp. DG_40]|nr:MAG: succinate-semialdehyde dehydrogenase [Coxiella sp. DG_40]
MDLKNKLLLRQQAYLNGKWINADDGKTFPVINPATQKVIGKVADLAVKETKQAIETAQQAFLKWRDQSPEQRSDILTTWAQLIKDNLGDLAIILTSEQGKPLAEAEGEIEASVKNIEWSAEQSKRVYGEVIPPFAADTRGLVIKQPIGVVGAVTPWNYPSGTVTHKIAPAIAAGCSVVLKPSKETPYSALALAFLAEQAGLPPGVFNVISSSQAENVGKELTENPLVRKISFTGSTETGRLFMRQSASTVKKISLELGGNAPFIVFKDANLKVAIKDALTRKFINCGQVCICVNRFLVHDSLYNDFIEQFKEAMDMIKVGNGIEQTTTMGPLINTEAIVKVETLINDAVKNGAKIIKGGKRHSLGGFFFEPTLIKDVAPDMAIAKQEIFGPVASVQSFSTLSEAVKIANDTYYGLASYFYTRDISDIFRLTEQLEYGVVFANCVQGISLAAPFGGFKQSGIGREGGKLCVEEFCETKYIAIGGI